jgi:hypothetical protein
MKAPDYSFLDKQTITAAQWNDIYTNPDFICTHTIEMTPLKDGKKLVQIELVHVWGRVPFNGKWAYGWIRAEKEDRYKAKFFVTY